MQSIKEVKELLRFTKKNFSPQVQKALREFAEDDFPQRFEFGNTQKYGYMPNTAKYEQQKLKKYNQRLPQLVASGTLRDRFLNTYKVNYRGLEVTYPHYGRYLIEQGKDFTTFHKEHIEEITQIAKKLLLDMIRNR